jgi:hypothetical protein
MPSRSTASPPMSDETRRKFLKLLRGACEALKAGAVKHASRLLRKADALRRNENACTSQE